MADGEDPGGKTLVAALGRILGIAILEVVFHDAPRGGEAGFARVRNTLGEEVRIHVRTDRKAAQSPGTGDVLLTTMFLSQAGEDGARDVLASILCRAVPPKVAVERPPPPAGPQEDDIW